MAIPVPRPLHVLVIDDDKVINRTIEYRLSQAGFLAETAFNGESALKLLAEKKFDLVILDLVMPGMPGFEVLSEFRRKDTTTPVVVLSVLHQEEDVARAKELGANECFSKITPNFMDQVIAYATALSTTPPAPAGT